MSARTHIQTEKELCAAARPPRRFFLQNAKTFLTFVSFSDKIHLACGGIAQLGERLNGIQEVSGSIPLISTTKRDIRSDVSFHFKSRGVLAGAPHPFLHFLSAQSCLWDWQSDSMKAQRKNGAGKGETICGFLHSYILSSACCVRAIWSLLLRSTIAINADGWRRASAMGSCLQTTNGGGAST